MCDTKHLFTIHHGGRALTLPHCHVTQAAEAGIIVSVLLALLKKTKQEKLVKYVWRGAVAGLVAALAVVRMCGRNQGYTRRGDR